MISGKTQLCVVVGDPVEHSLSPAMHNAGYRAAGLEDQFVYVACRVAPADIKLFVDSMRALHIRGASCTMPHKEIIMPYLDVVDEVAQQIGAVNTVVQKQGKLYGYNTDWLGTITPLKELTSLKRKRVAVLGAGGTAKAMVFGLLREGAIVTVHNRTLAKAEALATQFSCSATTLDNRQSLQQADIICNATPVGMGDTRDRTPIDTTIISNRHIVFDAIYTPYETMLLREAAQYGARIIHGTEMLLHQALPQFELFTGKSAPLGAIRAAQLEALHIKEPGDV
jgi:shikimate dehydrogenase